jgi:hypothetical protein
MNVTMVCMRGGLVGAPLLLLFACSSTSAVGTSGAASVTGDSAATGADVGTVRSAVLYTYSTDGGAGQGTEIEFLSIAPGVSCTMLLSEKVGTVGNIDVAADASTLPGQTFLLSSPTASLRLYDPNVPVGDAATPLGQFLVATTGTLTFASALGANGELSGTFDAEVEGTKANGATIHVTGTFTASNCGPA